MKPSYILNVVVIVVFCCTGLALSDNRKDESRQGRRDKAQYHQRQQVEKGHSDRRGYPDAKKGHATYRRGDPKRPADYHRHSGYSEHPYQRSRHYQHHDHRGHRYNYKGHWKSWRQWDRYTKEHPDIIKHGGYYRENAHLMFRFRDPVTGGFFFFSIGR